MSGAPIEQADKAICACLATLRPEDQFGIVAFGSSAHAFVPSPSQTMENRERRRRFSPAPVVWAVRNCWGLTAAMGLRRGGRRHLPAA